MSLSSDPKPHTPRNSIAIDTKKIRFNRHNDLVIIDETVFADLVAGNDTNPSEELIDELCLKLKCKRLAVKNRISSDDFRTPNVRLVRGHDLWVTHKDNGIVYSLDVSKCMFSFGNINEKLRVSRLDCTGETVVDLFAGIGYFTLVFAVHCRPELIHSCEWNPNAVEALRRNLELNRVSHKCVVHFGDNRLLCPVGVADRVYMGLIPTSLDSLRVACRALNIKSSKLILHIHENVSHFGSKDKTDKTQRWRKQMGSCIGRCVCEAGKCFCCDCVIFGTNLRDTITRRHRRTKPSQTFSLRRQSSSATIEFENLMFEFNLPESSNSMIQMQPTSVSSWLTLKDDSKQK
ncbi:unnamed protein product, partial [Medioppia subpectinata]